MIIFTKHAENKFEILRRHKFPILKKLVIKTLEKPDLIDKSRAPLLIAQKAIDKECVLRVVYRKERSIYKDNYILFGQKKTI